MSVRCNKRLLKMARKWIYQDETSQNFYSMVVYY